MKAENPEILLLQGMARNDRRAIETIYKENFNLVQSLVLKNNGTADDAKDIFQEAMIVLYEKVQSGTFELNCQLKTFLYSVCRRLWLKKLVLENRFTISESNEELAIVDEEVEEHQNRNADFGAMENAMRTLGEPCKSLIEAFYLQKKTMQDIASAFGYTNPDNAKNQKYKCLMRLKKLFFSQNKNGPQNG